MCVVFIFKTVVIWKQLKKFEKSKSGIIKLDSEGLGGLLAKNKKLIRCKTSWDIKCVLELISVLLFSAVLRGWSKFYILKDSISHEERI